MAVADQFIEQGLQHKRVVALLIPDYSGNLLWRKLLSEGEEILFYEFLLLVDG